MTWLLCAILLVGAFLLSGLETAILTVSAVRVRHQASSLDPGGRQLERLFARQDRLLAAVILLCNTCAIAAFVIVTNALAEALGARGYGAAFLILLPLCLLWLELLPTALFGRVPYRVLRFFRGPLVVIDRLLGPLMDLGSAPLKRLGPNRPRTSALGREEFRSLTREIAGSGMLSDVQERMISSVVAFERVTVGEVMIPLSRVTAAPLDLPVEAILNLARENKFHRLPILSETGDIVGVVDTREMLQAIRLHPPAETPKSPPETALDHLHRIVRASPDEPALSVVKRLRRIGVSLAAVYGGNRKPLGIVSAEDLVERMINQAAPAGKREA